jgi:GNAT superfamily N-acetyltransferase
MKPSIRPLADTDRDAVRTILEESKMFRDDEIDVALEVIDEYLDDPAASGYWSYVAVEDTGAVSGFAVVGPNPMTIGTFDLYWIVVDQSKQRKGIGTELIAFAEQRVMDANCRLLIAETSSKPMYLRTRNFYQQNGYSELAHIRDYYDVGDDLIIFGKYLKEV